jgi:hypothetical protein
MDKTSFSHSFMLTRGEMLYKNIQRRGEFLVPKLNKHLQQCYEVYKNSLITSTTPPSSHSPMMDESPIPHSPPPNTVSIPPFSPSVSPIVPSPNLPSPISSSFCPSPSCPLQPSSSLPSLQHSTTSTTTTSSNQIEHAELCTNFHIDARIPGKFQKCLFFYILIFKKKLIFIVLIIF